MTAPGRTAQAVPTSAAPSTAVPTSALPSSALPTSAEPSSEPIATAPTATRPIRVLLVDDLELLRLGFRMILDGEPDIEVVGEAADGASAIRRAIELRPDVVVMDVRMPGLDGIAATRAIVEAGVPSKVLILTTFDLDQYVHTGLPAGASGFLLKDTPPADLISAIRSVACGDAVISPGATRRLLDTFAALFPNPDELQRQREMLSSLTERERDVFFMVAAGASNAEVAAGLRLSEGTVKVHVGRILAKFDLRDRVQIVVLAYESGLISPGGQP